MHRTHSICSLASACLSTCLVATGPASAQSAAKMFDLSFDGGTATEYIEAVCQAAGHGNVLIRPNVDLITIEPLELKGVDLETSLRLLDDMSEAFANGKYVELGLNWVPSAGDGEVIYKITADLHDPGRGRPQHAAPLVTRVWSVTDLIEGGIKATDLAAAIDNLLDLHEGAPADTRFHEETGLLMIRTGVDRASAIESLLFELNGSLNTTGVPEALDESEAEVTAAVVQMNDMTNAAAEWKMKAEFFRSQIDSYQQELRELRQAKMECESLLSEYRMRIAELEHNDRKED